MAFVTITAGQTDANSPLDQPLMDTVRTNLDDLDTRVTANSAIGVTNGDSHDHSGGDGAPIPQGGIASSAIGQGELKTSAGEVSTGASADLILPGGSYGFYPQIKSDAAQGDVTHVNIADARLNIGTTYFTSISIAASSNTIFAQQRYITACPPFNLGNGDIPLFVFVTINNATGEIECTYVADTPPWFYNGRPENTFDARKYKKKKGKKNFFYDRQLPFPQLSILGWEKYKAAVMAGPQYEEIEITPDMKNLDMDIIPHPFMGNDLTGKSVVLLDPVGSMAEKMSDLHNMGESVADLLHGRYLLIDNEDVGANSPVGVKTHKVKWK